MTFLIYCCSNLFSPAAHEVAKLSNIPIYRILDNLIKFDLKMHRISYLSRSIQKYLLFLRGSQLVINKPNPPPQIPLLDPLNFGSLLPRLNIAVPNQLELLLDFGLYVLLVSMHLKIHVF